MKPGEITQNQDAAIRAKVEASGAAVQQDEGLAEGMRAAARDYLSLATAVLAPRRPAVIGIGGESGSGKSTIAAAIAARLGGAPGALVLRSDVTRKRLFDLPHGGPVATNSLWPGSDRAHLRPADRGC